MKQDTVSLVRRALTGDSEAFSELAEEHRRVAASVAYGILTDVHLAADAVQDAYLRAFQKLDQLKDPQAFVSWFLNIVRAVSIDLVRKRRRWGSREIPIGTGSEGSEGGEPRGQALGGSTDPTPAALLQEKEESVRIRDALAALPSEYREVILLKHQEGRSYREIARLLKTSVRAVESRLFRARQQLSRHLHTRGVTVGSDEASNAASSKAGEAGRNLESKKENDAKRLAQLRRRDADGRIVVSPVLDARSSDRRALN